MKLTANDEFNLAAKTSAEDYDNRYPEADLDTDWTETAYADLKSDVQAAFSWREFHDKVAKTLTGLRGE